MTLPVVSDLFDVLDRAVDRAGGLLTAGERRVVDRMRALEGEAAVAWARLTVRVPTVFEVSRLTLADVHDVPGALGVLTRAELVDPLVTWDDRARALRKADLIAAVRAVGLPTSGRREALLERLRGARGFTRERFVRVRHRGLLRRLERWAFLSPFPDRSTLVRERIGVVRWPDYTPTAGAALPTRRRAWLAYERLADRMAGLGAPIGPDEALSALRDGTARAPGRLDLQETLRREVIRVGQALEREGRPTEARELYARLVEDCGARLPRVAFRWAQALVAEDRWTEAHALLTEARPGAGPVERLVIVRALRRIARRLGRSVAPDPPLRKPIRREVRLERASASAVRPRWGPDALPIEAAICGWLRDQGRRACFSEGRYFTTLFALLFADVLFLEVPGALPVRWLAGPLDLGRPGFRERRSSAIDAVWQGISRGEGSARVREAWGRLRGVRIVGARWHRVTLPELEILADHLGPAGLRAILEPMLEHGLSRRRGLPDLVVFPGPPVRLPDALPGRLTEGLHLVEVKGPGDRLRDDQRLWLDCLVRAEVRTEVWEVAARGV